MFPRSTTVSASVSTGERGRVDDVVPAHATAIARFLPHRTEFNSALGPYKGGLRLHPTVNLSILKL